LRPPLPVPATREERYDDRDHTLLPPDDQIFTLTSGDRSKPGAAGFLILSQTLLGPDRYPAERRQFSISAKRTTTVRDRLRRRGHSI